MARLQTLLLSLANLLIPVAILVFATGFFPYKPFIPGLATHDKLGWDEKMGWKQPSNERFNKVVFMVVDALRSDFVFSEESGMAFVQSLIRSGKALPYTAHATSPTITMPRVKAITTGSIPSFLDVILNFAESDTTSTLATQDTWLAQLKARESGKLVMYGDDTWLKLFPDFFERADGTSSFFVSDFTEVDNNVTRHVPGELLNSDWNAMILHYLGLDHIGHKAGPKSPNMVPKQREMDNIVRDIYEAIENEEHLSDTLLVLCGDHGMNDGGNHGGSAPGETSPALVFMSPKLKEVTRFMDLTSPTEPIREFIYYKQIEQSDIVPTLAGLMGFPVPRNNLGVFIHDFLWFWNHGSDRIRLLLQNAQQMKKIVAATFPSLNFKDELQGMNCEKGDLPDGEELECKWQRVVQVMQMAATVQPMMKMSAIYDFCHKAQEVMSSTASNYDVPRLVLGTALAFLSFFLTLLTVVPKLRSLSTIGLQYAFTLILYSVLMFASSYVEEEHNFWYWAASGWFFYLFLSETRKEWVPKFFFHPALILLFLHRVARRWNQTGQKYAGADDIVHSPFLRGNGSIILWSLIGATYMHITLKLSRHTTRSISDFLYGGTQRLEPDTAVATRLLGVVGVLPLGATAFIFKLAFTARDAPELVQSIAPGLIEWVEQLSLVSFARMIFGGIVLCLSWVTIAEWRRSNARKPGHQGGGDLAQALFDFLTLFLLTQTRAQNIPLYLIFRLQFFFLRLLNISALSITLTSIFLAHSSFFILGNSNAISSIDLSNSYNGVSGYNIGAVGLLVFLSNWAGPVYWSTASVLLLGGRDQTQRYIAVEELDQRDWVEKEREHLAKSAEREKVERDRRSDAGIWKQHVTMWTLWTAGSLTAVMGACTVLRTHLFIWTVFSPKFLYAMAWGIAFHYGVVIGMGGLMWWVGNW